MAVASAAVHLFQTSGVSSERIALVKVMAPRLSVRKLLPSERKKRKSVLFVFTLVCETMCRLHIVSHTLKRLQSAPLVKAVDAFIKGLMQERKWMLY